MLTGRAGNDSYVLGDGDTIVEEVGGGIDTVQSALISLDLQQFANTVENATLLGTLALSATGTSLDNVLNGATNSAANVLTGLGGNDIDRHDAIRRFSIRLGGEAVRVGQALG